MRYETDTRYPVARQFSRQQVQEITGISDDVLGYWLREGLLVAIPSEGRKHRRFGFEQLHVAVILNAMRSLGANISVLRAFAGAMQHGIVIATKSGLDHEQLSRGIDLARSLNRFRRGEVVKVYRDEWLTAPRHVARSMEAERPAKDEAGIVTDWLTKNHQEGDMAQAIPFMRELTDAELFCLQLGLELTFPEYVEWRHPDYNYVWVAWLDSDGSPKVLSGEDSNLPIQPTPPLAAFYISVSRLVRPLWVTAEDDAADREKRDAWYRDRNVAP